MPPTNFKHGTIIKCAKYLPQRTIFGKREEYPDKILQVCDEHPRADRNTQRCSMQELVKIYMQHKMSGNKPYHGIQQVLSTVKLEAPHM